jgi:hypothetical protein
MSKDRFRAAPRVSIKRFPFNHIVIDDFLPRRDHTVLRDRLDALVRQGMQEWRDLSRLSKITGYDCYAWVFPPDSPAPLDVFIGREFHDYAADLFDIELTLDVTSQFHYHLPAARTGIWHTDYTVMHHTLNERPAGGMNVWHYGCELLSGAVPAGSTAQSVPRVRALAFLYYLGGDAPARAEDGGATELGYHGPNSAKVSLFGSISPEPNRLLIFECGPRSFHRAAGNPHNPRSLVAGWFHMTEKAAEQRHHLAASYPCEDAVKGRFDYNEATSAETAHVSSPTSGA